MDFKMSVDYLPIGTIVELSDGEKIMIVGYFVVDGEDETNIYDYCGCAYPEGYDEISEMYLFDEEQIEKVLFIGYEDDEGKQYRSDMAKEIDETYSDVEDEDEEESPEDSNESSNFDDINLVALDEIERL